MKNFIKELMVAAIALTVVFNIPAAYATTGAGKYISALEKIDGMQRKEALKAIGAASGELVTYAMNNPNAYSEIRSELVARGYTDSQIAKVESFKPRVESILTDASLSTEQKAVAMKQLTIEVGQVLQPATGSLADVCQNLAWSVVVTGVGGVALLIAAAAMEGSQKGLAYAGLGGVGFAATILVLVGTGICG